MKYLAISGCFQCRWLIYNMDGQGLKATGVSCGRLGMTFEDHQNLNGFHLLCPLPVKVDQERLGQAIQNIWENGDLRSGMHEIMEMAWGKEKALEIINSLEADRGVVIRNHDSLIYYLKLSQEIHERIHYLDTLDHKRTKAQFSEWKTLIDFKKYMDELIEEHIVWSNKV